MISDLLSSGISVVLQILILSGSLWIILRAQKVEYSHPGLLGAVIVVTALDHIPYYGHFVAFGALLWLLEILTHAEWPRAIATTVIGYAIQFCFTFWLLGPILGSLESHFESFSKATTDKESTNHVSTAMSTMPPE